MKTKITKGYIKRHHDAIIETLKEAKKYALRTPTAQYTVCVDTNGDIFWVEAPAHDRGYDVFKKGYQRYGVYTFCDSNFDILWDYWYECWKDFCERFEERFHIPVEMEDGFESIVQLERDALETCKAHGISEGEYEEWQESEKDEAAEMLSSETDYEEIFDDFLLDCFCDDEDDDEKAAKDLSDRELAEAFRASDEWSLDLLEELFDRAGMNFAAYDGGTFESGACEAAEKLGIEIF